MRDTAGMVQPCMGHALFLLFIKCYIELEPNAYVPGLRFGSEHGDGEGGVVGVSAGVVGVLGDVEAVSEVAIEGQVGHVTVGQVHSSHSSQQLSHGSHSQSGQQRSASNIYSGVDGSDVHVRVYIYVYILCT